MLDWSPAIWLASYRVPNPIDNATENDILKAIDSDISRGLLSFRHSEMFWYT